MQKIIISNSAFRTIYLVIGVIGLSMPWILRIIGYIAECITDNGTVSSYYYSSAGGVFVGCMTTVGVLVLCSDIGDGFERRIFQAVAIGAILIGIFPMEPDIANNVLASVGAHDSKIYADNVYLPVGYYDKIPLANIRFHDIGNILLFGGGSLLGLVIFPNVKMDNRVPDRVKRLRIFFYRFCGLMMVVCLGFIYYWSNFNSSLRFYPESFAISFFGLMFLIRSQILLSGSDPVDDKAMIKKFLLFVSISLSLCASGYILTNFDIYGRLSLRKCVFPEMPFNKDKENQIQQPWAPTK